MPRRAGNIGFHFLPQKKRGESRKPGLCAKKFTTSFFSRRSPERKEVQARIADFAVRPFDTERRRFHQGESNMKTPMIIAALSIGCAAVLSAQAQPSPLERINIEEFIGPFKPTPESRADARKEAIAAYAQESRLCRATTRGQAQASCMQQARQDRDSEMDYAMGSKRK
jgi:hypothetical protein